MEFDALIGEDHGRVRSGVLETEHDLQKTEKERDGDGRTRTRSVQT